MSKAFLKKLQALRTATLLKTESCEIYKIFKNSLIYWTYPVAASDSFRIPACNFIKKEIGDSRKDVFLSILQGF